MAIEPSTSADPTSGQTVTLWIILSVPTLLLQSYCVQLQGRSYLLESTDVSVLFRVRGRKHRVGFVCRRTPFHSLLLELRT